MSARWPGLLLCAAIAAISARAAAEDVHVAVAANFSRTLETLAPVFRAMTGHTLRASTGSTGALYAQIKNGAPFEVFLSADAERTRLLEREGLAAPGTRFVYAQGKLVLWSPDPNTVDEHGRLLAKLDRAKVAVADPATAPYGAAAREVLSALGLWQSLLDKGAIVTGTSVTHAHQFAASRSARCAFVALSQVIDAPGSRWLVPQKLYAPLLQEGVLLRGAARSGAARAFVEFLREDPEVTRVLRRAGYERPRGAERNAATGSAP